MKLHSSFYFRSKWIMERTLGADTENSVKNYKRKQVKLLWTQVKLWQQLFRW